MICDGWWCIPYLASLAADRDKTTNASVWCLLPGVWPLAGGLWRMLARAATAYCVTASPFFEQFFVFVESEAHLWTPKERLWLGSLWCNKRVIDRVAGLPKVTKLCTQQAAGEICTMPKTLSGSVECKSKCRPSGCVSCSISDFLFLFSDIFQRAFPPTRFSPAGSMAEPRVDFQVCRAKSTFKVFYDSHKIHPKVDTFRVGEISTNITISTPIRGCQVQQL